LDGEVFAFEWEVKHHRLGTGLERHYSVAEIAEMWGLSEKTVLTMFEGEDVVLRWGTPETAASAHTLRFAFQRVFLLRVHRKREQRASLEIEL
jgi:hypothetical protein